MLGGMMVHTETLATGFYDQDINFKGGDFLKQKITMKLFRKEQHIPGTVIDRDSIRGWKEAGGLDTFGRARVHVKELLASYSKPELDPAKVERLHAFVLDLAQKAGMDKLPDHDLSPQTV
jgi:trimethylamine:corrinoid methyltransferase-like protein